MLSQWRVKYLSCAAHSHLSLDNFFHRKLKATFMSSSWNVLHAGLFVFTRNTLWGGPLLVVDALLHRGRPGGWVMGSMGFPFLVSPCWERQVCSSLPAEYQCTAIQPAAGLPSLSLFFFFFFSYGHILFPKFPLCLLHRFGNFTSFFEDITFTLQSFIGPLSSVFFDFCSVEFIASVKLFSSNLWWIVCSSWESMLASSINRSLPPFIVGSNRKYFWAECA